MTNLFETKEQRKETASAVSRSQPLAARMRPSRLEDVLGQEHILGPGKLLRRAVEADRLGSLLLYGPPGCGKTSLAEVIARITKRRFERTSGVLANVAILRKLLEAAVQRQKLQQVETILFIDEIHRFNKAQQDVLLPYVEEGSITLIGATTHNPMFFVNSPLISRSQVFELKPLSNEALVALMKRALTSPEGLAANPSDADPEALEHLAHVAEGDARKALNSLEIAVCTTPPDKNNKRVHLTLQIAEESIQKKAVLYDADEDGHHDTISAFIKSVRGSDPDAATYWLAKMLYAGEDPRFIARRLIILASEDIGNADPRALTLATSVLQAVDFVGMPEARISLAQVTTYLACAPKSNAAYLAVDEAMNDIRSGRTLEIPDSLKSKPVTKPASGYKYAHDYAGHVVDQDYLPAPRVYYRPTDQGYEATMAKRLDFWKTIKKEQRARQSVNSDRGNPE